MECYAFCKENKENMETHIDLMLNFMEKMYIDKKYGYFISNLSKTSYEEAEKALKFMIIMHDSGKSLKMYQESCSKNGGFRGHEFISAYLAYSLSQESNIYLKNALSSAIMLHHHTMMHRAGFIYRYTRLEISIKCIDFYKKYYGINIPQYIYSENIHNTISTLSQFFRKNTRLVYAFLYPLTIVDNLAASKRDGRGTLIGNEAFSIAKKLGVI